MNEISTNLDPLMTRHLVETGAFAKDPVVIVDVGARWGFNAEWKAFGNALQVYCFEPDEEECKRLNSASSGNVKYIPAALGCHEHEATLFETKLVASTGLYKTNMDFFSRMLNRDNAEVVKEHRVQVTTLDKALERFGVKSVDFIKLDVEGAELDVLVGADQFMKDSSLFGILSEIRFQEEINGSPIFWELDAHVRKFGFRLFNMRFTRQSRHALPYPGLADYRMPDGKKFYAYTTHGQIMDGDALYFRDFMIPANKTIGASANPMGILKAAAFFEIYCLNDCAAELIIENRDRLTNIVDCNLLLDMLAAPMRKQKMGHKEYLDAYFGPGAAVVDQGDSTNIDVKTLAKQNLPWWLKRFLRRLLGR
jgi:FkbM family methyltransferase